MRPNHQPGYTYPNLRAYGAISLVLSVIVMGVGAWVAFETVREAESDAAALTGAAIVGVITFLIAVTLGIIADIVRWMHDVVNLLDEQSEYLSDLPVSRPDRT